MHGSKPSPQPAASIPRLDGFRFLMRDLRWIDVPMIETPKDAAAAEADRRNLATLRALRAGVGGAG